MSGGARRIAGLAAAKARKHAVAAISYGVPGLLLLVLAFKLATAAAFGVAPGPAVPPDGYVASEDRVTLYWRRGSHEGAFTVQVAVGTKFDAPVFIKKTTQTSLVLPRLEPGREYCWRVVEEPGARRACFTTQPAFVPY